MADLFLDTWPFCAHTTAADALRAGLPLVTRTGNTFPSRVAESVLAAAGLGDLVARDNGHFIDLSVALASRPDRLAAVKRRVAQARTGSSLFDRTGWTRDLERAYGAIAERARHGLPPARIELGPR